MDNDSMIVSLRSSRREPEAAVPVRKRRKQPWKLIALALLVIGTISAGVYFRASIPGLAALGQVGAAAGSAQENAEEVEELVAAVGKLIVLPKGEDPTVASVSDPDKLKDQPFFANAKIGDKVLIYTKARKAYLYDPKQNKLLEVAPLTVENPQ